MFSVQDLVVKYDAYTDEQVFEVYTSIDTYSNEAKEALNIVIAKRVQIEVVEVVCSKPHTLTRSLNTVPANDHLQQKHQTRRKE